MLWPVGYQRHTQGLKLKFVEGMTFFPVGVRWLLLMGQETEAERGIATLSASHSRKEVELGWGIRIQECHTPKPFLGAGRLGGSVG